MTEAIRKFNSRSARSIGLAIIFVILSFALWLNASYILHQYKYVDPLGYLDGTLTRNEYIDKYRLEFPTIRYINENLPKDTKILFIYLGKRGYYCDREYVLDMNNNRSTLRQLVKKSDRPEKILSGLKEMGITHLLINYDIFDRWLKTNFTPKDREVMKIFFKKYVQFLFFKWGYGVSRLEYFD